MVSSGDALEPAGIELNVGVPEHRLSSLGISGVLAAPQESHGHLHL